MGNSPKTTNMKGARKKASFFDGKERKKVGRRKERKEEGKKEGGKERRKEGKKEGRKEGKEGKKECKCVFHAEKNIVFPPLLF